MPAHDNIGKTREMFAAFKQGDLDGVMVHVADEIEHLVPTLGQLPWGGRTEGRGAFRERLETLEEHFSIDEFDQQHFMQDGAVVAVVSTLGCTLQKNGQQVSAMEFIQLLTFNDSGQCVRISETYDATAILAAWQK